MRGAGRGKAVVAKRGGSAEAADDWRVGLCRDGHAKKRSAFSQERKCDTSVAVGYMPQLL